MTAGVPRREDLDRGWRRVGLAAAALLAAVAVTSASAWERPWYVSFNWTQSLPFWVFVIDRTAEPRIGDYVDFWPPENPYYKDISFIKRVVAVPGDEVRCNGRAFFVGGKEVAVAKTRSQRGAPLAQGPCGLVPAGHYFVAAPHKDSFDSRYEAIGYVSRSRIRGVAYPIL